MAEQRVVPSATILSELEDNTGIRQRHRWMFATRL